MYTMEQLRAMSPEELEAVHKAASKRLVLRFAQMFVIKFAIFYGVRKAIEYAAKRG
jgi:hypothetical protein